MTKELEELLFSTIKGAMAYATDRQPYGNFDFSPLFNKVEELENEVIRLTDIEYIYEGLCK